MSARRGGRERPGARAAGSWRTAGPRAKQVAVWAALGVALLTILPPPAETDAAWVDAETARASLTALTVPAPVGVGSCVTTPGLLGLDPAVTVNWRAPAGADGYTLASAEFGHSTGGLLLPLTSALLGNVRTTGTPEAYKTVANGGLLGGLLGGTSTVAIRFVGPGGWHSPWLVATASMALAGLNPTCTLSVIPSA